MSRTPKPSPAGDPRDNVTGGRAGRSPGRMGQRQPAKGFGMNASMRKPPKRPKGNEPGDKK